MPELEGDSLNKIKSLVESDKNYAFVLDYALFGSPRANSDGGYHIHSTIIPKFHTCLELLVKVGIIEKKSGHRHTGSTSYFEVTIDRNNIIEILKPFYEEIRNSCISLESYIQESLMDFYHVYEHDGSISFSEDQYPKIESVYKELVKKGLMLSWDWITRAHQYRCYKFREQPVNCLESFKKIMNEKLEGFVQLKIEDYLQHASAARLDYLLGLTQTKSFSDVDKYMKERGWSEKIISQVKSSLDKEKMLTSDLSSSLFKILEGNLEDKIEEINELVQVRKPQELNRLRIVFRKENLFGKTKVEFVDIVKTLEGMTLKLREKNVEILVINKAENSYEIKLSCNRLLYLIKVEDSEIYSLPTFYADKAVIIGRRIQDYTYNQYIEKKLWDNLLLIGFDTRQILGNIVNDTLFRSLAEQFRVDGIPLSQPIERIIGYYESASESLKSSLQLKESFVYTEPYNPWPLQQEFLTLLKNSANSIKICVPYPDASTFSFLASVLRQVSLKLLILSDKKELKGRNRVNVEVLNRTIKDKRIEIKRNPEIHVRFIIFDDEIVMFSSSDLKDSDLKRKYQFGFWTNNPEIVKKTMEYFDIVWRDSILINLFEELKD